MASFSRSTDATKGLSLSGSANMIRAAVAALGVFVAPVEADAQSAQCASILPTLTRDLKRHPEQLTPAQVACLSVGQVSELRGTIPTTLLACLRPDVASQLSPTDPTRISWESLSQRLTIDDLAQMSNDQLNCFSGPQIQALMQVHQVQAVSGNGGENDPLATFLDRFSTERIIQWHLLPASISRIAHARDVVVRRNQENLMGAMREAGNYFASGRYMDAITVYDALYTQSPHSHGLVFNMLTALSRAIGGLSLAEARRDGTTIQFRGSTRALKSGEAQILGSDGYLTEAEYRFFINRINRVLNLYSRVPEGGLPSEAVTQSAGLRQAIEHARATLTGIYEPSVVVPVAPNHPIGPGGPTQPRVTPGPHSLVASQQSTETYFTASPVTSIGIAALGAGAAMTLGGAIGYGVSAGREIDFRDACNANVFSPACDTAAWRDAQSTSRVASGFAFAGAAIMAGGGALMTYGLLNPVQHTRATPGLRVTGGGVRASGDTTMFTLEGRF